MTPSLLLPPPSTPPNRPPHRIHRKPFAFTLDMTFAFPPLSPHHLAPGAESPRLLSSPEPQSSPCTSDFDDDEGYGYDSENESDIGEEEDRYRRGLSMPRLQASLNLRAFGGEEGGRRINFARPLGSQGAINLQQQEQVELDSEEEGEEEEEACKMIVDKDVVQHLFGRSIQRTRRINSITNTISTRDLSTLGLDSSPLTPLARPPLPATLSNPTFKRITPTPSIRSELSSASHSSLASRRLASTKAAYKDEFAEMVAKDEAESTSKRIAGKEMMVLEGLAGLGLFEDQVEEEHEERRRGIDFGGVSELGMLNASAREDRKEVLSPVVLFDDDDEDVPDVKRGRKAFSRGRSTLNSPFASSSRPSTPIAISVPQPLLSTPISTTKFTPRSISLETPYDFAITAHTPASALALLASIPTSEHIPLPLPLPSLSASLQPSLSLSSSLRSVSSSNATSASSPEGPPRTIIAGAYTTRQNRQTANPAPPIGLRELRELRIAALVLEMDAKRHVKVPGSLMSHPREMEKKVKRKPVPVGVDGEDTVVIKVAGEGSESGGSGSGSPSELVERDGKEFFLSFPKVVAPILRSSVRPRRSSARPFSIAIMPSSPPTLQQTLSSSDAIPLFIPNTAEPSSLLLLPPTSSPSPAPALPPPTLVRRSTISTHARANNKSTSSLPLPTRGAPLPPTQRSTLPATSVHSTKFKLTLPHLASSSSLHYDTHSRSRSRSQRRRSSGASSTSSFESCPIPPTPLEASFFPSCPTPLPEELPRTNSLLFDLLRAEEAEGTRSDATLVEDWSAGVKELKDADVEEVEVRRMSRRNASSPSASTSWSFSSSHRPSPNTNTHAVAGVGLGLGLGLGMKSGELGGLKGLKWGTNLKQSGGKIMGASLGGKRVWSGTKALNGGATTTTTTA